MGVDLLRNELLKNIQTPGALAGSDQAHMRAFGMPLGPVGYERVLVPGG